MAETNLVENAKQPNLQEKLSKVTQRLSFSVQVNLNVHVDLLVKHQYLLYRSSKLCVYVRGS